MHLRSNGFLEIFKPRLIVPLLNWCRSGPKEAPPPTELPPRFRRKMAAADDARGYHSGGDDRQSKSKQYYSTGSERHRSANNWYDTSREHYDSSRAGRRERAPSPGRHYTSSREYRNSNRAFSSNPNINRIDKQHHQEQSKYSSKGNNELVAAGGRMSKSSSDNDVIRKAEPRSWTPEPTQARSWDKAPGSNRKSNSGGDKHSTDLVMTSF